MRIPVLSIVALSAVASAQDQIPLFDKAKSWFNQAASYVQSAAAAGRDAAASNVAEQAVTDITWENWRSTLQHNRKPKPYNPDEAWMVFATGGNKTCHGRCGRADRAWNEAASLFAADPSAPKLGKIDCESEPLLCGAWATNVPSVWFFLLPKEPTEPTPIHIFRINITSVTAADFNHIHTRKLYLEAPLHEGPLHPFDGWVVKYGLMDPMAYALFYISKVPNWGFMIFISLFSRWFVNKRMPRPDQGQASGTSGNRPAAAGAS